MNPPHTLVEKHFLALSEVYFLREPNLAAERVEQALKDFQSSGVDPRILGAQLSKRLGLFSAICSSPEHLDKIIKALQAAIDKLPPSPSS